MHRFASILEGRINIDGLDQVPGCHRSRSEVSGTGSCPSKAINNPVSRVRSISGKFTRIGITASVIVRYVL
jgi:hypothetical protein